MQRLWSCITEGHSAWVSKVLSAEGTFTELHYAPWSRILMPEIHAEVAFFNALVHQFPNWVKYFLECKVSFKASLLFQMNATLYYPCRKICARRASRRHFK